MRATAERDGGEVAVWLEQEPGSGGKESAEASIRNLAGFTVHADRVTGDSASGRRRLPRSARPVTCVWCAAPGTSATWRSSAPFHWAPMPTRSMPPREPSTSSPQRAAGPGRSPRSKPGSRRSRGGETAAGRVTPERRESDLASLAGGPRYGWRRRRHGRRRSVGGCASSRRGRASLDATERLDADGRHQRTHSRRTGACRPPAYGRARPASPARPVSLRRSCRISLSAHRAWRPADVHLMKKPLRPQRLLARQRRPTNRRTARSMYSAHPTEVRQTSKRRQSCTVDDRQRPPTQAPLPPPLLLTLRRDSPAVTPITSRPRRRRTAARGPRRRSRHVSRPPDRRSPCHRRDRRYPSEPGEGCAGSSLPGRPRGREQEGAARKEGTAPKTASRPSRSEESSPG